MWSSGSHGEGGGAPSVRPLSLHPSPCLPPLLPWFWLLRVGQDTGHRTRDTEAEASSCSPRSLHFLLSSLSSYLCQGGFLKSPLPRGISGSSELLWPAPVPTDLVGPAPANPFSHSLLQLGPSETRVQWTSAGSLSQRTVHTCPAER